MKALEKNCLKLAELHSMAVDYPKTGEVPKNIDNSLFTTTYPDYMEGKL